MSDSESRSYDSLLRKFIRTTALIILLAPAPACADPFLRLHNEGLLYPAHEIGGQTIKRSVTVGLNENGDLMIRHSDLSLIVAYNSPTDAIDQQERIRIAQRQDLPVINGISFKVSLLF
ncbi:MAG: hypothetical protein M0T70_12390 [Geobacteraceae bacterium]|nr:hypothetical protein [Geobacteraceae bacterium]